MEDFLLDPEGFAVLMDKIADFECDLMRMAARHGFHGIHFADDWGTQSGMMVSPAMWRKLVQTPLRPSVCPGPQPGTPRLVSLLRRVLAIMEDFHEIGVDVLNISQPNVNDIVEVGRRLRGRQCFMIPISYQTVSIRGTPQEIYQEAERLYDLLAVPAGGFIGYVEEYSVMGMSAENYHACGEAFRRLKCSR